MAIAFNPSAFSTAFGGEGILLIEDVLINGVSKEMLNGWRLSSPANGRASFQFDVLSRGGAYRPALDDQVLLTRGSDRLFGGFITDLRERGVGNEWLPDIVTEVTTIDFNVLADRRVMTATIPSGTLKDTLTIVVSFLDGVTLDTTQVLGPVLPAMVYTDVKVVDMLNGLTTLSGGFVWAIDANKVLRMFEPGTEPAPFNIVSPSADALGDVTVQPTRATYANRVIVKNATLRKQADDVAEQALRGVWEVVFSAPDETAEDALQAMADTALAQSTPMLKQVVYTTERAGLKPGQSQTITLANRNVNNTFLITEVNLSQFEAGVYRYQVTAIEGLVYQTGWRETYRNWNSGGSTNIAGGSGGGSAAPPSRYAYFLGGNGVDATRSPTPTWVPASGGGAVGQGAIQVQLNTVVRRTTAATITARIRALDAGVSVKARLYDVTDSVACAGESALVVNTQWETVVFNATLTPGSHLYELQLLPGLADAEVMGTGYLE